MQIEINKKIQMPKRKLSSPSLALALDIYLLELNQEKKLLVDKFSIMRNCSRWIQRWLKLSLTLLPKTNDEYIYAYLSFYKNCDL